MYGFTSYAELPYATIPYATVQTAPTVALNTPTNTATGISATPDLVFTGTDSDVDAIEYSLQVDTVNTFDSHLIADQSIAQYGDYVLGGTGTSGESSQAKGQSFTADGSVITKVALVSYTGAGTPTGDWVVTIRSGSITGTVLGTSTIAVSALAGSNWNDFVFSSPIPTTAGTKYYIQLSKSPDVYDDVNYMLTAMHDSNLYAGGGYFRKDVNAWGAEDTTTYDMMFRLYGALIGKLSVTPDATFTDVTNGANTHPFASGDQIKYTVQAGDILTAGTQYFWRVGGIDPTGSNTYGAWSSTWSFTVSMGIKVWDGSTWGYKPAKVWNGTAWVVKPIKVWNGSAWVNKG